MTDFIFLGSKITADGDCNHEIKRRLLLGRKTMTELDSILKSRDITLLTKMHIVKAMVFPVVMYTWESWTIKKVEHQRIDAFELWCWRRLLRVPWTARRSNQSILEEINPEYSLEGLMLKLKLQYFGHLMQRTYSFEKTLVLGKIEGKRRRGWQKTKMVGWHHWLNGCPFEQTLGNREGQESLVCFSPWGHKELDMTWPLKYNTVMGKPEVKKRRREKGSQGKHLELHCFIGDEIWPGQTNPSVCYMALGLDQAPGGQTLCVSNGPQSPGHRVNSHTASVNEWMTITPGFVFHKVIALTFNFLSLQPLQSL